MIEHEGLGVRDPMIAEDDRGAPPLLRALAGVDVAIGRIDKRIDVLASRLSPLAVLRDSTGVEPQPESVASEIVTRVRRNEKVLLEIDARLDDLIESLEV